MSGERDCTKRRLLLINNMPISYRNALFSEISNDLNLCTRVVYLTNKESVRSQIDLSWLGRANYRILSPWWQRRAKGTTTSDYILQVFPVGEVVKADLIVAFGYSYVGIIQAAIWARLLGKRVSLFCESTQADKEVTTFKRKIRASLVSWLFDSFIVPGQASRRFLSAMGVADHNIDTATNADPGGAQISERRQLMDGEKIKIGLVGRIAPEKMFLWAIEALRSDRRYQLHVAGDGPLMPKLRERGGCDTVIYGVLGRTELMEFYRQIDILLLPSLSEPWGFVANEALAFGCPVILSDNVGARFELTPMAGLTFKTGDPEALRKAVAAVVADYAKYSAGAIALAGKLTVQSQAAAITEHLARRYA